VRLWPHTFGTSGFFAALITKTAPLDGPRAEPPSRPLQPLGWEPLARRETQAVEQFFQQEYGFDLPALLERQQLALWRRGDGIHAFPLSFLSRFAGLPVEGLGLLVAEQTPQGLQISHEWAARFGRDFQAGTLRLPADYLEGWLRGEDAPLTDGDNKTVVVMDEDGRILGRGRLGPQRLKNLLPRRLV
jgi:16S rRNA (cytosine1407-C5)-methyltransferase